MKVTREQAKEAWTKEDTGDYSSYMVISSHTAWTQSKIGVLNNSPVESKRRISQ